MFRVFYLPSLHSVSLCALCPHAQYGEVLKANKRKRGLQFFQPIGPVSPISGPPGNRPIIQRCILYKDARHRRFASISRGLRAIHLPS